MLIFDFVPDFLGEWKCPNFFSWGFSLYILVDMIYTRTWYRFFYRFG